MNQVLHQLRRMLVEIEAHRLDMTVVVDKTGLYRDLIGHALEDDWFRENTVLGQISQGWSSPFLPWSLDLAEFAGISKADARTLFAIEGPIGASISKEEVMKNLDRMIEGGSPFEYEEAA